MPTPANPIAVPEGLPALLRDLIHEHTGMFFDPGRLDVMMDKLAPLVEQSPTRSFMDYYFLLKDGSPEEWTRVMDVLSVQETYFWREMDQIHALVKSVVPQWFAREKKPLRIWSAACATGEEPYTIAIALSEAGYSALPIQITATDGSCGAIARARRGLYRERSFRTLPPDLRARYFRQEGDLWQLNERIMGRVRFDCRNIAERSDVSAYAGVEVIFCRNVFIYFSPGAITRTVGWMADNMPEDGKLFVGASESLLKLTTRFELQQIDNAFVYVRKSDPATGGAR